MQQCVIFAAFSAVHFWRSFWKRMGLCIAYGTAELQVLQPSLVKVAVAVSLSQGGKQSLYLPPSAR